MLSHVKKIHLSLLASFVVLASSCTQKLPNYPPAYREYAYVTNGKSNSVSVLDMRNYNAVATIPVGANPTGIAANSQKNEIYVVNTGSNSMSVIDAEQNKAIAIIALEHTPYFVDVSADGTRAYVANSGSNSVSIIDLSQRRVVRNVVVGRAPGEARVSRDGKTIVVTERLADSVSVINAETMSVRSSVAVCKQPTDVAILPDSGKAFVACSGSGQVAVIGLNMESPTESQQLTAKSGAAIRRSGPAPGKGAGSEVDRLLSILDVGSTPIHLALKPDGGQIFVSNFGA
ncbi:MAG: hypothetical protein DMG61_11255, partial [Acidobacteria bacterium]